MYEGLTGLLQNFSRETVNQDAVRQISDIFQRVANSFFSLHSIAALIIFTTMAYLLGRIIALLLRRLVNGLGRQADKTPSLQMVNRLRRYETIIVISIALIRTFLFLFALYLWWIYIHPNQQPTALIGASALLVVILGGALGPALRDISTGSVMMAEQWYAVGDHIRIEPFMDMQGVVERVTLRSTRIRGLNGEVIWVNNQNIQGVRITPKGIRTIAIEVFVSDLDKGVELIEWTNKRLPAGELLVINPLKVMTSVKVGDAMWHITAIAETAPSREWLIEKYAIDVMTEIDDKYNLHILVADPISRYADGDAERRFARSISNARKAPAKKRVHSMHKSAAAKKKSAKL